MSDLNSEHPGKPITGRKVFAIIATGFAIIIGVNLTMAYLAVSTFPGLEVKNSYVASQNFQRDREAQLALGWDVAAEVSGDALTLSILKDGQPVEAEIISATFGRATFAGQDQSPELTFDGAGYVASVDAGEGNWNLRLVAKAKDGTMFRQRVIVSVVK